MNANININDIISSFDKTLNEEFKYIKLKVLDDAKKAQLKQNIRNNQTVPVFISNIIKNNYYCLIDGMNFSYLYDKNYDYCNMINALTKKYNLKLNFAKFCDIPTQEPTSIPTTIPSSIPSSIPLFTSTEGISSSPSISIPQRSFKMNGGDITVYMRTLFTILFFKDIATKYPKINFILTFPCIINRKINKNAFKSYFTTNISDNEINEYYKLIEPCINKNPDNMFNIKIFNNLSVIYIYNNNPDENTRRKGIGELDDLILVMIGKMLLNQNKQFCIMSKDRYKWDKQGKVIIDEHGWEFLQQKYRCQVSPRKNANTRNICNSFPPNKCENTLQNINTEKQYVGEWQTTSRKQSKISRNFSKTQQEQTSESVNLCNII